MDNFMQDLPPLDAYQDIELGEYVNETSNDNLNEGENLNSVNDSRQCGIDESGSSTIVNDVVRSKPNKETVNGFKRIEANKYKGFESNEPIIKIKGKPISETDLLRLGGLNKKYTHVNVAGKHKVISKVDCPVDGQVLNFESLHEFRNNFLNQENVNGLNLGDAWLAWQDKNFKPNGLNFYPNPDKCPEGVFNTFSGFKLTPKQGDVSLFLNHIKDVFCCGDEKVSNYLIGWLAHILQKPEEKPSVAILLKSVEGTGKGTFFEPLKRILGSLSVQVNGGHTLTNRFNGLVDSKILVFADEVDLREPRTADKIKGLISEPRATLERKGIDPVQVQNHSRFIFASNHDFVIKAGSRERRYLVLEPDKEIAQKVEYFKPLWYWIENDGPNFLMDYLLNYDLTDFDPRRAPLTIPLIEEKLSSLSPIQNWIFEQLCSDNPFDGALRLDCSDLTRICFDWCESSGYTIALPSIRSSLGKTLKAMSIRRVGRSNRGGYYELGSKAELRSKFAKLLGCRTEEIFD